jgi:hypothetical protein
MQFLIRQTVILQGRMIFEVIESQPKTIWTL